ncbi:tetratricopeptide repeat protein, partial [bacterium]|nr:tetratricopeptide repeat protein [bacterium]
MEFEAITQFREAYKLAPNNIEVLYVLGADYHKKGIVDKAMEYFDAILQQAPQHLDTLTNMGLICQDKNLYQQAIGYFTRVLEIESSNLKALSYLNNIHIKQENYIEQLDILLKISDLDPENDSNVLNIAYCYFNLMNYGKTEDFCLKILAKKEAHQESLDLLCKVYLKQQNYKAASKYLLLNLKANPQKIDLYLDLFQSYFQLNELEKAGKYIIQALNMDSKNIKVLQTALSYYREVGNIERQTEICNTLLSLKPDDYAFKRQMAKLLMEQQMYKEASNLIKDMLEHTPNDTDLLVSQAKIYTIQGLPSKAIIQLQQVLSIDINNAMAHFELGRTFHTQREWNKAVVEFKKAVNLGINDPMAYFELGNIYSTKGMFENALDSYQKSVELEPDNIEIHMQIAEIYFKLNQPDKALYEYESLMEKQPSNIQLNLRLAHVYQTNRMFTQALSLLEKLLIDNEDNVAIVFELGRTQLYLNDESAARGLFAKVLELEPSHLSAQAQLAVLDASKNPQEAIQTLKKMISISPSRESFVNLSKVYIDNNMIDQAVAEYKVLTKTYPENAEVFAEIGKLYTILSKAFNNDPKMRESALDALSKSISLNENYPLSYFYLGQSYHLANNLEASLINLKKAYQLDPQNLEIKEFLSSVDHQKISIEIQSKLEEAKTFLTRGMDQNAIIEYEHILDLDPFHSEANFDLATIYLKMENLELSTKHLENSVEKNPQYIRSFFELAKIYRMQSNLNQAEIELLKVLELDPNNFDANVMIGSILAEAGDTAEAGIYLQRAAEINTNSPLPLYEMGKMFLNVGEIELTKHFYDKCYKLDPSNKEVSDFFVNVNQEEQEAKLKDLLNQAKVAEQDQDLEKAKLCFEEILSVQPNNFYSRYKSGRINEYQEKFSDAAFDYQQAYNNWDTSDAEFKDLPVRLGLLLAKLQRPDEAIPVIEQAFNSEPKNKELHLTLIDQYKKVFTNHSEEPFEGKTSRQVLDFYQRKVQENSNSMVHWMTLGYIHRVNLIDNQDLEQEFTESFEAYVRAHNLDKTDQHTLFHLGLLSHFSGKISKSKEYLKGLITLNSEHIDAHTRLFTIYKESKDYDDASNTMREMIQLDPSNGMFRMHLI